MLSGAACFAVIQALLALTIYRGVPRLADPVFGGKAALLRAVLLESHEDSAFILVLGSSRAAFGIDAQRLAEQMSLTRGRPVAAFNFGMLGVGPSTELLTARRLFAAGVEPDLLLIEVLPPFLAGQCTPPEARWFPADAQFNGDELALLQSYHCPTQGRAPGWLPGYAHRLALMEETAPWWLPAARRHDWLRRCDAAGWTAQVEAVAAAYWQGHLEKDRQLYAEAFDGYRPGGAPGRALRELLLLCRSRNVRAALLLMPESTTFQGWYPAGAAERARAYLDDLGREFRVPLIDARRWADDDEFFDAHHLLARGATRFSTHLGETLLRGHHELAFAREHENERLLGEREGVSPPRIPRGANAPRSPGYLQSSVANRR